MSTQTKPRSALGYSFSEFAALVGLHRTTVSRMVTSGALRVIRVTDTIQFIPCDEVDRLVATADFKKAAPKK